MCFVATVFFLIPFCDSLKRSLLTLHFFCSRFERPLNYTPVFLTKRSRDPEIFLNPPHWSRWSWANVVTHLLMSFVKARPHIRLRRGVAFYFINVSDSYRSERRPRERTHAIAVGDCCVINGWSRACRAVNLEQVF